MPPSNKSHHKVDSDMQVSIYFFQLDGLKHLILIYIFDDLQRAFLTLRRYLSPRIVFS